MGAAIAVTEFIDPFGLGRYRVPQHDVAPVGDSGQKTLGNAPGLGAIFFDLPMDDTRRPLCHAGRQRTGEHQLPVIPAQLACRLKAAVNPWVATLIAVCGGDNLLPQRG